MRSPRARWTPLLPWSALVALALTLAGCGGSGRPGDAIVMVSTRDGDYALYGMSADGHDQGRLTEERGDPSTPAGALFQVDPSYSPDGTRIAFASARSGRLDVYVMDADGANTRRLTSSAGDQSQPTWSPDGKRIAYQSDHDGDHVYVMTADGKNNRRLTSELVSEIEPAWSPDGRWIAYSRRAPGFEYRELWIVRPDGSDGHRLTCRAETCYGPAWSPNSKTIAFAAREGDGHFEIFTVRVDGTGRRRMTYSTEDAFEPAWSPDGAPIAFSRDGSIVTIDSAGHQSVLTDPDGNDSSPDWNPRPAESEETS